ncbi:tyrosine-type recombinase/integrase [Cognatiyoonia sp. IB215446]|uniref:tyrosine-type recombinase/integrase n=1 Tax=Cognatiyoonia sp. IB215446 TaxID=3097355 RepID=UPI002A171323|nr:tyrosine-type recombinase/integrase [Cognatiyoonia sp. IB215446]MDX8347813.1 tyrosine-type recombinase/integrase [Cognatiyoonia sp. IB215446]
MTKRPNEKNERTKRDFLNYRKHAKQLSEKTLDREVAALERFDVWNGRKDFAKFHIDWAMGFRAHLEQAKTAHGKPLGKSTQRAIIATLREFVIWLSQQDGFRRRIRVADAEYFRLSLRDEAEARAAPERPAPSIKQAQRALATMPEENPRDLRDKAIFALLCLTGIRVGALITLKIKHVDLEDKSVTQNPREVATKRGKSIVTFFSKGFKEAEEVLGKWMAYLDEAALYSPDDPLFPATALEAEGTDGFKVSGFQRRNWTTTEPVRRLVNAAFKNAGLEAFGPHSFRHMLSRHVARNCNSVAELVATSQNLGHTDVLTTLRSYGHINRDDQRRLVTGEESDELIE